MANPREDVWIHTACEMCNGNCGIRAHRVDGVVVKLEGDPNCPQDWGRMCAKGNAGIMQLYDPNRVTSPLKRTNPEKGIGVDPRWQEITWEEALDTVTERLRRVRQSDPRKLVWSSWDNNPVTQVIGCWASAFGTPNGLTSSFSVGAGLHATTYMLWGAFQQEIDLQYCNFLVLFGAQYGHGVNMSANLTTQKMADARSRGMKLVVVDPVGTNAAAKADEWVPIRPGTDSALALAMTHVLLNEMGCYDAEFLRRHTNAGYLVARDGRYLREPQSKKPLVWDEATGKPLAYDAPNARPALTGSFTAYGQVARPGFALLQERASRFTPEAAEPVTTVPAATARRLAREYGEAARVGSTIVIEGVELPYRPVAALLGRGITAHQHSWVKSLAIQHLNTVVGAVYVPGGFRGTNPIGPGRSWAPRAGPDGLLVQDPSPVAIHGYNAYEHQVTAPESLSFKELYPIPSGAAATFHWNLLDPERRAKLPYTPEVLVHARSNILMDESNPQQLAELLKAIPFIVSLTPEIDEVAEFADIVLPDTQSLERLNLFPNRMHINNSAADGFFTWCIQQPVLAPPAGARTWRDVLMELAQRLGFTREFNQALNRRLRLKDPYRLEPDRAYTYEEIADRWAKTQHGPERGLAWFQEHGTYTARRSIEERYPLPYLGCRIPLYCEVALHLGERVRAVAGEMGLEWDIADYDPLPDWKPCPSHADTAEGDPPGRPYDLIAVNYKLPIHFMSVTSKNAWLDELSRRHPYAYKAVINRAAGEARGLRDGDIVWVESEVGKVKGEVKLSDCVHAEVVAIAGELGSWAQGKPLARGKGLHFGALLPLRPDRIDGVTSALDGCVRVKVYRA